MKGYILNPDMEHVQKIINGVNKKNGHCPCQLKEDETTMCPCDSFTTTGHCCCKLFIPQEN